MSRFFRIFFAILAPLAVILTFAVATHQPGPPEPVDSLLAEYLQSQTSLSGSGISIERMVKAARPGSFTPQMSQASFGSGMIFRTQLYRPLLATRAASPCLTRRSSCGAPSCALLAPAPRACCSSPSTKTCTTPTGSCISQTPGV